jgi:nitroreductase
MSIEKLVLANRSYRAFDEGRPITEDIMKGLIDLARRTPSGMNRQPLRYRILSAQQDLDKMRTNVRFAPSLGLRLPHEGHRPTGYIIIFTDKEANSPVSLALKDVGIAAQTILLAAAEQGFGGCMLGSFDPTRLKDDFGIDARYEPQLVIALGTPDEKVVLHDTDEESLSYYRDADNTHHVPKRSLNKVLI